MDQRDRAGRTSDREQLAAELADAVAALSTSFALHSRVLHSLHEGVVMMDAAGRVADVNPAAAEMLGHPRSALVGRVAGDLQGIEFRTVGAALPTGEFPALVALRTGTGAHAVEVELRRRGETRRLLMNAEPIFGDSIGELSGVVATFVDITAERESTERLRRQAELLDLANDAILARDAESRVVYWNAAAERLYGWPASAAIGNVSHQLLQTRFGESAETIDEALTRDGVWEGQLEHRRADGTTILVASRQAVRRDGLGEPELIIEINSDVTAQVAAARTVGRLAAQLATAQRVGQMGSIEVDVDSGEQAVSAEMARICGLTGTPSGEELLERVHPDDREWVEEAGVRLRRGERVDIVHRIVRPDGEERALHSIAELVAEPGERRILVGTVHDVTDQRRAEARQVLEEQLRVAFEHAPIGMLLISPDGGIVRANEAICSSLGLAPDMLVDASATQCVHPDDGPALQDALERLLAGSADGTSLDLRYLHAGGAAIWMQAALAVLRDERGRPRLVLAQLQDVTERRHYEHQLSYLADHDPLTGLVNRRRFEQELARHLTAAARYGPRGAVLLLDLDHFKYLNDSFGHSAGDELLISVGQLLSERVRASDVLARLGGDEFAILIPEGGEREARALARGVCAAFQQQAIGLDRTTPVKITVSIGVAVIHDAGEVTSEELLVKADRAMYEAKELGRNRFAVASGDGEERPGWFGSRTGWLHRLRTALDEDRFELHAQPILDIARGRIDRYEVLLRLVGEDGGLVAPGVFLEVADRLDLMPEIDRHVVRKSIALAAEHERLGTPITIEVNLSGKSLGDEELLGVIQACLAETPLGRDRLIFEVTETAAVANIRHAREFAEELTRLGCRFALDDFGAGFGSFYYLKHLPFDYLKIDGEFIRHGATNRADQLMVGAIVDVARGLGKETIAEYVEDEAALAFVTSCGIDYAQGYHVARPGPFPIPVGGDATA